MILYNVENKKVTQKKERFELAFLINEILWNLYLTFKWNHYIERMFPFKEK